MKKDLIREYVKSQQEPQHTPTRKAKIGIGPNFNSQTFEYNNGTPGDLMIPITSSEIKTWKHIVRAVNCHAELLAALKDMRDAMTSGPERILRDDEIEALMKSRNAIARAEGE